MRNAPARGLTLMVALPLAMRVPARTPMDAVIPVLVVMRNVVNDNARMPAIQ